MSNAALASSELQRTLEELERLQLGPEGRPYPELARILAIFEGAVETPYTVAFWLVSPQDLLEGETPAAWVRSRRDPEHLLEAARRAAAALSH